MKIARNRFYFSLLFFFSPDRAKNKRRTRFDRLCSTRLRKIWDRTREGKLSPSSFIPNLNRPTTREMNVQRIYSPYVGWKYRFHLPVSGLRSLSLYRTLQFFARFHRGTQVRKVYLRSTVTRRRIDTCGISFRNNQFGSNKRLIVAISSCIENKRVSFNAMLLGITRLQPELSADHSETFHLCYRIFR